jgi:hypothetical protein
VWTTEVRDASFDRPKMICETSEREEHYVVPRQIVETQEREQRTVVRRPVCETSERDEYIAHYEPVTTCTTQYVDHGGYVDQWQVHPGATRNSLTWVQAGYVPDPATGAPVWRPAGLYWIPYQAPAQYSVNKVYVPNVVAQQVPQTTMVQKVEVRKVPVQTTRYVDQEVVQRIPVQVCKLVNEEHVRKVPVVSYKQVLEHVDNKVNVQVCHMVETEVVNKIPVRTMKMVDEEKTEKVQVQVCKYVEEEKTVSEPVHVTKKVPVTFTERVPRTVVMRIPVEPCCVPDDCCDPGSSYGGNSFGNGYSNPSRIYRNEPTPADRSNSGRQDANQQPKLDGSGHPIPGPDLSK